MGKGMAFELTCRNIPIECFCDSDPAKCGRYFAGYMVRTLDEMKRIYPEGSFQILLTLGSKTAANVKEDFIDNGIFARTDFYDEKEDPLRIMPLFVITSPDYEFPNLIPQELRENFRQLDENARKVIVEGLLVHYYCVENVDEFPSDCVGADFWDQLYGRLEIDRKRVIPWLNDIHKLRGATILEIGCGTGASTVALSEQGAIVTAIDTDAHSLEVSRIRLDAYGLSADVMNMNAAEITEKLPGRKFDLVIYFASLEHMTFRERIQSLRSAFNMLTDDGHVVFVEIPNRLWFIDLHTSHEPFYNWLPDDLAMEYSRFTPREGFNLGFDVSDAQDTLCFARWGRGVSYHELEVALGGRGCFQVTSTMSVFWNWPESAFKKILKMCGPQDMHEGFYDPYLYIAMRRG